MASYRDRDLKLLWGRSGGRCAFTECRRTLIGNDTDDIIGHIAHILGRSDTGPRPNPVLSEEERDAYDNLILLCPTHHAEVDAQEGRTRWTADDLRSLKRNHERWVESQLAVGEPVRVNVSQFYYLNITRLAGLAFLSGHDVDLSFIKGIRLLADTGLGMTAALVQFERILRSIHLNALVAEHVNLLDEAIIGATLTFEGAFRTRNLPTIDDIRKGKFSMCGLLTQDPQIYRRAQEARLVLPIDPKWITSTTGFAEFRPSGGKGRFAGACTVAQVDLVAKTVVATPLFIGIPRSQLDSWCK